MRAALPVMIAVGGMMGNGDNSKLYEAITETDFEADILNAKAGMMKEVAERKHLSDPTLQALKEFQNKDSI